MNDTGLRKEMGGTAPGSFLTLFREKPLLTLLIIALALRVLAAVYAKGYQSVDDYWMVIGPVTDWLDGEPTWFDRPHSPPKRPVLYQYTMFALFWLMKQVGITNPSTTMFINRLLHAMWSVTLIPMLYYGLRRFADQKAAWIGTLLFAVHFINPFMSVRNMVEVVCRPFLLSGLLVMEVAYHRSSRIGGEKLAFLGGILLGLAYSARLYLLWCVSAVFLLFMIKRRWRESFWFAVGVSVLVLTNGIVDYLSWGWFLSSIFYTLGSGSSMFDPPTGPPYTYALLILGVLIPPFSLFFGAGVVRALRRVPVVFWATTAYFLFHSLVPAKQERYMLPIFPSIVFLGTVGLSMFRWRDARWMKGMWTAMWIVNFILLPVSVFNYSQKARVEPMVILGETTGVGRVIVVMLETKATLPYYYMKAKRDDLHYVTNEAELEGLTELMTSTNSSGSDRFTHVVLFTRRNPETYVPKLEEHVGALKLEHHIEPSIADWILTKLNPRRNHSKESYIYSIASGDSS